VHGGVGGGSPGCTALSSPKLIAQPYFVGLNSPALPLLMFLVLLGFMHSVPGRLEQAKRQQRVKQFLVVNINYYMLFTTD